MRKLFPGLLAVAPTFGPSTDCERTGLKADFIQIVCMAGVCSYGHSLCSVPLGTASEPVVTIQPASSTTASSRGTRARTHVTTPHESYHPD
jgi:hypothetical protein